MKEGRTNSFSGKSTYKKDVREGRGWTHEGEGRTNFLGGESACEKDERRSGRRK